MAGLISAKSTLGEIQQSNMLPLINYSHYDTEKEEKSLANEQMLRKKPGNNDMINRSRSEQEKEQIMKSKHQEIQISTINLNTNNEQNLAQAKKNNKNNQINDTENLNSSKNFLSFFYDFPSY